jgi:hypothetical protein
MLLLILVLGLIGTAAELILVKHYEDWKQVAPLGLIGLALVAIIWHAVAPAAVSVRALQVLMTLFVFAGPIGMGLHLQANSEFEHEMDPTLTGYGLFTESLAGATPLLAPGSMVQLGLLGLLYTYRHPRLPSAAADTRRQEWDA